MPTHPGFLHYTRGHGRPQILLIGNGLERSEGQFTWNQLIDTLAVSDHIILTKEQIERIPFPLLYELLSSHSPAPAHLKLSDIEEQEHRLAAAMGKLKHISNPLLERLPFIGANHIFTTNYSYCIEKAFYPKCEFSDPRIRSRYRFNMNEDKAGNKALREVVYRLHTGYKAENQDKSEIGLWHIHGECSVPRGVVLGHDRYGRILSRIERVCSTIKYEGRPEDRLLRKFVSWPELFLYGDIYVIGFGYYECEYDLWWLLRRKQRERYADGKLFFYDKDNKYDTRKLLLQAHGAILCNAGAKSEMGYDEFYRLALDEISERIRASRLS